VCGVGRFPVHLFFFSYILVENDVINPGPVYLHWNIVVAPNRESFARSFQFQPRVDQAHDVSKVYC
jgi:hypothetical protein